MPNEVSSVVEKIWHILTCVNQSKTLWINIFVNTHSIKECSIESLSPQYRHSLSVFIPNLNNSFLVTIGLWINLNWNSFSLVSLQIFFSDLKILVHTSLFKESFSLQHLGPVWSSVWILTLNKLQKFLWFSLVQINLCRFVEREDIIISGKEWSFDGVGAFG